VFLSFLFLAAIWGYKRIKWCFIFYQSGMCFFFSFMGTGDYCLNVLYTCFNCVIFYRLFLCHYKL